MPMMSMMPRIQMMPTMSLLPIRARFHVRTNKRLTNECCENVHTIRNYIKWEKLGKNLFLKIFQRHTRYGVYENVDVMLYARPNKVHCSKTTDALRTEATWNEIHMENVSGKNNNKNNKIVPTNDLVCWRKRERTMDIEKLWK